MHLAVLRENNERVLMRKNATSPWRLAPLEASLDDALSGQIDWDDAPISSEPVVLGRPLVKGARIVCVGLNFVDHAKEAGLAIPEHPALFIRLESSLVAHGEQLQLPPVSEQLDYEIELGVVIGKSGAQVPASKAMEHVFGYTILADNSIRDWQKHSRQVTAGKNFDKTGAIGPWIVAKEDVSCVDRLAMRTSLDGEDRQRGSTEDMIFSVSDIVSYTSSFMELRVGDVLAMGTPAGVAMGEAEPRWMKAGQTIEMNIEGIGALRNDVAAHPSGELND